MRFWRGRRRRDASAPRATAHEERTAREGGDAWLSRLMLKLREALADAKISPSPSALLSTLPPPSALHHLPRFLCFHVHAGHFAFPGSVEEKRRMVKGTKVSLSPIWTDTYRRPATSSSTVPRPPTSKALPPSLLPLPRWVYALHTAPTPSTGSVL